MYKNFTVFKTSILGRMAASQDNDEGKNRNVKELTMKCLSHAILLIQ
jgi:hypothetical protein